MTLEPNPDPDATPDELAPDPEELAREAALEARLAARRQAAGCILPGPLAAAFAIHGPDPAALRPVTLGDLAILSAWQHPLARALELWLSGQPLAAIAAQTPLGPVALGLAQWLWTQPACVARAALAQCPRSALAVGDPSPPSYPSDPAAGESWRYLLHVVSGFATLFSHTEPTADGQAGAVLYQAETVADGVGWWLRAYGTLLREFHLRPDAALDTPLSQALALQMWVRDEGAGLVRTSAAYIEQETVTRLEAAHA